MRTILLLLALTVTATAQNIIMKDGKVVVSKGLRRQGDTIMATIERPGGAAGIAPQTDEIGYPLAKIAKLDFPEPAQFKTAQDMIAQGKGTDLIVQLEPILKFYEGFRDAPGTWWINAALLKVKALVSVGREKDAESLAAQIAQIASDPENQLTAQVQVAAGLARKGIFGKALEVAETALKQSKDPGTLAQAALVKGQCLSASKQWEDALLSFLHVTVFYPGEKALVPQALLGVGRAQFAIEDLPSATASLKELIDTYPASGEAAQAKTELQKVQRREKALGLTK